MSLQSFMMQSPEAATPAEWKAFAAAYDPNRENVSSDHPDYDWWAARPRRWVSRNCTTVLRSQTLTSLGVTLKAIGGIIILMGAFINKNMMAKYYWHFVLTGACPPGLPSPAFGYASCSPLHSHRVDGRSRPHRPGYCGQSTRMPWKI